VLVQTSDGTDPDLMDNYLLKIAFRVVNLKGETTEKVMGQTRDRPENMT
jgi:hypothetical protein